MWPGPEGSLGGLVDILAEFSVSEALHLLWLFQSSPQGEHFLTSPICLSATTCSKDILC